jgi:hypothetical protein
MNLNSAVFDNVLAIDERLKQLELEVGQMDQYYAHKQPSATTYSYINSVINNGLPHAVLPQEQHSNVSRFPFD